MSNFNFNTPFRFCPTIVLYIPVNKLSYDVIIEDFGNKYRPPNHVLPTCVHTFFFFFFFIANSVEFNGLLI